MHEGIVRHLLTVSASQKEDKVKVSIERCKIIIDVSVIVKRILTLHDWLKLA